MANKLKQGATGTEADSIFKGDWAINTTEPNIGGGPSHSTGFYTGAHIPEGGYVIYYLNEAYVAINDADLLGRIRGLGGDSGSVGAALAWAATEPSIVILNKAFNNEVTDGLVLKLDPSNISSFIDNKPTTNLLAAYGDNFVRAVTWTNSGQWTYSHNATNNDKPIIHGIDLSDVNLMHGKSVTTGSQHFGCTQVTVSPSETYTMSVYYYHSRAGASRPYMRTGVNNNNLGYMTYNGSTNTSLWPVRQWIRVSVTATVQSNENRVYLSNYLGRQVDDQVWYCAPQVELGTEMTAFAKGTRLQNTTLYDLSAGNRNGTLYNTPSFKSIGAISFDGVNDYSRVTLTGANLDNSCTIEGTLRRNSIHSNWRTFFNIKPNGATYPFFEFRSSGGTPNIYGDYYIGSGEWSTPAATLNAGDFGHAVATHDGNGNMKMYLNGELIGTRTGVAALNFGVNPILQIGLAYSNDRATDIDIAGIKIYDKAISQSEVLQNYYQAPIITDGLALAIDAGNLVSYEEGLTTAYDLAGTQTASLVNSVGFDNNRGSWVFDGVDANINLGNPSATRNSEFSVCFFYNPSTVQNHTHNGIINGITPNGRFCLFWYAGNRVSVQYRDNSGLSAASGGVWQRASAPSTLSADNWYFIQITGNENTGEFKCGVNLIESPVSNSSQYVDPDANDWVIGRRAGAAHDHAKVTNLLIYDRILTTEELAQNFNAQRNRFGI